MSTAPINATQPAATSLWDKVRANYTQAILLAGITAYLPYAYFTASGITSLVFLIGLFLLGHLRSLRAFLPVALCTAVLLILGLARSDFVDGMLHGKSVGQAWHDSKHYFLAPILTWAGIWAVVCAGYNLSERQSARVFKYFGYIALVLTALLATEALSHYGVRDWINRSFFKGARPEMVVVRVSDSNFLLLYLFWPLTMYFMARRWIAAVIAMVVTIIALSVVVDTNSQLLALAVSTAVFFAAKHWPRGLWSRKITPERTLAAAAAAFLLAFPFIFLGLMRSGVLPKIAPHIGDSWRARFDIWGFAVTQALKKPIWGWGYESSRNFEPFIPEHPHSPAMQAWMELGIPGLIVVAAMWFFVFWCLAPKGEGAPPVETSGLVELGVAQAAVSEETEDQRARPYVLAAAVTFFVVNAISYGIWRDWLYAQGAVSAAAMMMAIKAVAAGRKFQI